jgi:hypothetical protein
LSEEEAATLKLKRAKRLGMVLKAGQVSVEIGKSTKGLAKILEAIQQQNSLLVLRIMIMAEVFGACASTRAQRHT